MSDQLPPLDFEIKEDDYSQFPPATFAQHQKAIAEQDFRKLRAEVGRKIIWTLWAELVFLAILIGFQGFKWFEFNLNEWAFGLFVNGVVWQTFFLVRMIVQNLFPNGEQELSAIRISKVG